jgi:hypothetical protein
VVVTRSSYEDPITDYHVSTSGYSLKHTATSIAVVVVTAEGGGGGGGGACNNQVIESGRSRIFS